MKTSLPIIIGMAVLTVTMLCNSFAWAGARESDEIRIGSIWASGGVVAARYSSDITQYISCDNRFQLSTGVMIYCNARDKDNNVRHCETANPRFLAPLLTITDASHLTFYVDSSGHCTHINVRNGSALLK